MNHSPWKKNFAIFVNLAVFFVFYKWLAQTRNIDGDEGLYLEAARLVSQGKKLYIDFFYQQMPVLPYLYAAWMKLFGFTIFSARYLSAFLTALTGWVLLQNVYRKTQSLLMVNLVGLMFLGCGGIIAWAPVLKTHPLNMLTLTASCFAVLAWRRSSQVLWLFLAGIILGIGVNARLTLGPFLILYSVFVLWQGGPRRWLGLLALLAGMTLPSIPTLLLFLNDPALFIRYNLTYHTHVYPGVVDATRRLYTAENLLYQTQFLLLVIIAECGMLMGLKKLGSRYFSSDDGFVFISVLLFFAIHMSSAEPYTQYFVAIIPLLIFLTIPLLEYLLQRPMPLAIACLALFFVFYLRSARSYRDFEIISMLSDRPEWALKSIRTTALRAKRLLKPGEECLTWWPGYAFIAGCRSVPGMENHMRNYAVQRLVAGEITPYKLMTDETLLADLKSGKYRVIIDGVYHIDSPYYADIQAAIQENYWDVGQGVKVRAPSWFKAFALPNN